MINIETHQISEVMIRQICQKCCIYTHYLHRNHLHMLLSLIGQLCLYVYGELLDAWLSLSCLVVDRK